MENNLYKKLVNLNYTVFSNNDVIDKIVNDEKFKDNVIATINGLLFLEKNHATNLNEIQFGKKNASALVKLLNEKVSFNISDLTVDKIEEELIFFSTMISNTFGFSKDSIFDSGKDIQITDFMDFVKAYKEESIKEHNATTIQDEATIQINTFGDSSQENIKVKNINNNQQANQQAFNQQGNMGQLFQNPMNSDRFYPFKTKPKEMRYIKYIFAGAIILIGIMFIVIYSMLGAQQLKIDPKDSVFDIFKNAGADDIKHDSSTMRENYVKYFKNPWLVTPYTLITKNANLSTSVDAFSIILNVFTLLILFSAVYPMLKLPKNYKDQYRVNGGTLFLFGIVIIIYVMPLVVNTSGGMTSMIFYLGFKDSDTNVIAENFLKWMFTDNYLSAHKDEVDAFITIINDKMDFMVLRILSIITITLMFVFLAMYIALLFINPKIDREKYRLFIIEVQKKAMAQMQGKDYEIDPSLFESDEEMAKWEKKKGKNN